MIIFMSVGVVVYAKNLEEITAFYARESGVSVSHAERGHAERGPDVTIVQVPDAIAARIEISGPPTLRQAFAIKPVFDVPSLAAVRRIVADLGGGLNAPQTTWQFGEWRVCDGWDPEGNVFQIRERESLA